MGTFQHRIAIVGNPAVPDTRFDDAQLRALTGLGYNTVQLNIAWGSRPADEPLNIEDVISPSDGDSDDDGDEPPRVRDRGAELRRRARACPRHGRRTLFHFGSPRTPGLYRQFTDRLQQTLAVRPCVSGPAMAAHYRDRRSADHGTRAIPEERTRRTRGARVGLREMPIIEDGDCASPTSLLDGDETRCEPTLSW